jgi:hypothetical protein
MSTHLAIMAVDAYIINSNDLYELNQKYKKHTFDHLHPYTINKKEYNDKANNGIIPSNYYLQFSGHIKEENPQEYTLFDFQTFDEVLGEEISACGAEELFQGIDFKKILSHFPIKSYKNRYKILDAPLYLIVQMDYFGSYDHYSGATEYELDVDIVGYLDSNLEKTIFDVLNLENER